uniref:Uncharacterized protein n=1 Tax=Rhizophora mucronata TaxID=61149 RepID=A0A2P2PYT4_RHIMU
MEFARKISYLLIQKNTIECKVIET